MAGAIRAARREAEGDQRRHAASPGETVENWLVRNGQTPRLREMLWDPLALAALNQPPTVAAAPPFARVLGEMFGADPRGAAIALPTRPLDAMYAMPAREYIEARDGSVKTGVPAKIRVEGGRVTGVAAGAETWTSPVVISAVPWFALARSVRRRHGTARAAARCRASHVGVSDRHRQPVVRPSGPGRTVYRPARTHDAVGVRQAAGGRRRGVASDAGVERRGRRGRRRPIADLIAAGASRADVSHSRRSRGTGRERDRRPRAARDVFARAWPAGAPVDDDGGQRLAPRRRLGRHGIAGDDRRRGSQRSLGRAGGGREFDSWPKRGHDNTTTRNSLMNSVVVHYKELALKGRNRPWFIQLLVRNLRWAPDGFRHRVDPIGDGPDRNRAWPGRAVVRDFRPCAARLWHRELLPCRSWCRSIFRSWRDVILNDLGDRSPASFRVSVRRADKRFPLTSPQIEREVGGLIKQARGWLVDLEHPALTIHVEMLPEYAFYFFGKEPGAGGLPTGHRRAAGVPALGRHRLAGRGIQDDAARLLGAARSTSTAIRFCRGRRRRRSARSPRC